MADDEKSFRERVEEIREKRQQEQVNNDVPLDTPGQEPSRDLQSNPISFEQFLEQAGTEFAGCRVVVETDNSRLEFTDQSLYKTYIGSDPMYQLLGEPDKKEPLHGSTEGVNSGPSDTGDGTTKVFRPDASSGADNQHTAVEFCPGCGTHLESFQDSFDSIQFCPSCGQEL